MAIPRPIVIDFETEGIESRPRYPPKPVGFSIKRKGDRKSRYYAWGHPTENNCDFSTAQRVLLDAWNSGEDLLFHNAKFDVDVAQTFMGCGSIDWRRVHDTMFLLFLHDPHALSFSLKPSADRLLGMPPEERDAVARWLVDNQKALKEDGLLPSNVRITEKNFGAWICLAPGALVGKYADGDVDRTDKLFKLLLKDIHNRDMMEAYDRERQCMFIFLQNEREGVRVDRKALREDLATYEASMSATDNWLRKRLKSRDLNIDSDADLAEALDRLGLVTSWEVTKTGQRSVAKKNLTPDKFTDQKVARALGYRNRLATCMGTFMRTWLEMADVSGGLIFTNWNQVRQSRSSGDAAGARTGRVSSNPNLMNVPKNFYDKDDGYAHPSHLAIPELPLMRRYFLPDKGGVFCHRDYNQQELRILAHFEDDSLMAAYNAEPLMDVHSFVQSEIKRLFNLTIDRRPVKILNFGMLYGMGLAKLAIGIHTTVEEARRLKDAQRKAIPGLADLEKLIKARGKAGEPIITWGGRQYFTEEPKIIDGRTQTFEYKLLNYLIQGSAADCTKQALINFDALRKESRFLVTVHDEINISAPKKLVRQEMALLREAMESVKFDVPMVSDGKTGPTWGALTKYKEEPFVAR